MVQIKEMENGYGSDSAILEGTVRDFRERKLRQKVK